eukprot:619731-Amphidinium_carterae.1
MSVGETRRSRKKIVVGALHSLKKAEKQRSKKAASWNAHSCALEAEYEKDFLDFLEGLVREANT